MVARSEAGCASRPTIEPTAAARIGPFIPNSAINSKRPSCDSAHSPTCSTPTLLGRASSRESTSTDCRSRPGDAASGDASSDTGVRASSCAAMRWASSSSAGGASSSSGVWPLRISSMRWQSRGHCSRGISKWPPRLSRVCCRTLDPIRSLLTRRWGCSRSGRRYGGFACVGRTWGDGSGGSARSQYQNYILWHYIHHSGLPTTINQ